MGILPSSLFKIVPLWKVQKRFIGGDTLRNVSLLMELEEIKRKEREKRKELEKLPPRFYPETIKKIEEMHAEARSSVEKMDIEKASRIMEIINKCRKSLDDIISLRLRKILIFSIWKGEREIKNLTPEEKILYMEIKSAIERHHNRIFQTEDMERETRETMKPIEKKRETGEKEKVKMKEAPEKIPGKRMTLVRVKMPFHVALPEGDLDLRKEDVLHLPAKIAKILARKGIVEEIKI